MRFFSLLDVCGLNNLVANVSQVVGCGMFCLLWGLTGTLPAWAQTQSSTLQSARQPSTNSESSLSFERGGSIVGSVVSQDGHPLPNVSLTLREVGSQTTKRLTTHTDHEGKFYVHNLPSGAYEISTFAPGYCAPPSVVSEKHTYFRPGDTVSLTLIKGSSITGKVLNQAGEPITGVCVWAIRTGDLEGRPDVTDDDLQIRRMTDDRGWYRLYGLPPGKYLIATGGNHGAFALAIPGAFDGDAPTYFPSATRDTATEVTVQNGQEISGIDIRYRGERGHNLSGVVSGAKPTNALVVLTNTLHEAQEATIFTQEHDGKHSFAFYGIADGEYELTAQAGFGQPDSFLSVPHRVVIKGNDITGVELPLMALSTIAGHVTLNVKSEVSPQLSGQNHNHTFEEIALLAHKATGKEPKDRLLSRRFSSSDTTPNINGDFTLRNLEPGTYHLETRLPDENWYVASMTLGESGQTASTRTPKAAQEIGHGITLKSGEKVKNLSITLATGAASLNGRVISIGDNRQLPDRLRVILVPLEPELAHAVLRYAEATVTAQGIFSLKNLAPGRYGAVVRPGSTEELSTSVLDDTQQELLRREAKTMNVVVELQPFQRAVGFFVPYKKESSVK